MKVLLLKDAEPEEEARIFLSRRNLLTLLSKLDRAARGEETQCAIYKTDNQHPRFAQTMSRIRVTAVEDHEYYTQRSPGPMHPADDPWKH